MTGEVGALKALWQAVFGDTPEEIDGFFAHFYAPERAVTLTENGELAAMAHLLPVGDLVAGEKRLHCAMIYAVASAPHLRGRGYGRRITEAACQRALSLGFDAAVLHPAGPSLFDFYEKLGFAPFFSACFTGFITLNPLNAPASQGVTLRRVSAGNYAALRRDFFKGRAYIDFTPHALSFQETLCGEGGLFAIERSGEAIGCAIVEAHEDEVAVKELLCAASYFDDSADALTRAFPVNALSVCAPEWAVPDGEKHAAPFGMLYGAALSNYQKNESGWYGPAFD